MGTCIPSKPSCAPNSPEGIEGRRIMRGRSMAQFAAQVDA
jgi:hypothetical protein